MSSATFTPPLQLEAAEYRRVMSEDAPRTLLINTFDKYKKYKLVVMRLRDPGTQVGHFGGISLACELICAAIARELGLNVPEYAVVKVTRDFVQSIRDKRIHDLLLMNIGEHFGSMYHRSLPTWNAEYYNPSQESIRKLEDILTFDAVIMNSERTIWNPNLLSDGSLLIPIDHSLALINCLLDPSMFDAPLILAEHDILNHCVAQQLRWKGCSYRRILDKWEKTINSNKLNELRKMLPCHWYNNQDDIDKIFSFLESRHLNFRDISNHLMEVLS